MSDIGTKPLMSSDQGFDPFRHLVEGSGQPADRIARSGRGPHRQLTRSKIVNGFLDPPHAPTNVCANRATQDRQKWQHPKHRSQWKPRGLDRWLDDASVLGRLENFEALKRDKNSGLSCLGERDGTVLAADKIATGGIQEVGPHSAAHFHALKESR
jgi:hypothetical protein